MADKINTDSVVTESPVAKYAPLVKTLAALGAGLASDSPVAKGISQGLAQSVISNAEKRQIADEIAREQANAEAERKRKINQQKFQNIVSMGYKLFDTETARATFYESAGAFDYLGIAMPEIRESQPSNMGIDYSSMKSYIDNPENGLTQYEKDRLGNILIMMAHAESKKDGPEFRRMQVMWDDAITPKSKTYYKPGGKEAAVFSSPNDAFEAGFVYSNYDKAAKTSPNAEYENRVEPYIKNITRDSDVFNNSMLKYKPPIEGEFNFDENKPYNYYLAFLRIGDQADKKVNVKGAILGSPPSVLEVTPFWLFDNSYEVAEAADVLSQSGVKDKFNPYDVRAVFTPTVLAGIKTRAAKRMAEDLGVKIDTEVQKKAPKTNKSKSATFSSDDEEIIQGWMDLDGLTRQQAEEKLRSL